MHCSSSLYSLMTATVPRLAAPMLALCLLSTACDEEALGDEDLAAQDDDDDAVDDDELAGDVELRGGCLYGATPPSSNDNDTLIGPNDVVESEDAGDGGCDLHMFRVTADAPADRARTIDFHATSYQPFDDWGGRVWTKSCAGNLCAVNWSASVVSFTQSGGGIACPSINSCFQVPYMLEGQVTLSATNSVADIRAGMRASDDDGDPVLVTITVSE
jgi:hypothetical protein